MMRSILACALLMCFTTVHAQELPRGLSDAERQLLAEGFTRKPTRIPGATAFDGHPPSTPRTPAEWEELQAITITWTSYPAILTEIVRHAKEEVRVIIITTNENQVRNTLQNAGVDLSHHVEFVQTDFNSIWIRDYGANPAYLNGVDSLILIDWLYNRPRAKDDVIPYAIASYLDVPIYGTVEAPDDLVHTGGNFMSDGHGRGFSSNLVLTENGPGNIYGISNHPESAIDDIMQRYMGINEFVKMTVLPFDGIHHIDMHMKLLDESTLLVGRYPDGIADGPQIEANLQYVIAQFKQRTGRDYRVIRIPMPPDHLGRFPHQGGHYRTYANAMMINKTILVPVYAEQYDTTALRIWREAKPGYNIVGINCNQIIPASGALHCIIKEVSAHGPLWISHYQPESIAAHEESILEAQIRHRSGIAEAQIFYRIMGTEHYDSLAMEQGWDDHWTVTLPHFEKDVEIEYYFKARAQNGKTTVRPLPAPEGYFRVYIESTPSSSTGRVTDVSPQLIAFPNPAKSFTAIRVNGIKGTTGTLALYDLYGRQVLLLHQGMFSGSEGVFVFDAGNLVPGYYIASLRCENARASIPVIIQ